MKSLLTFAALGVFLLPTAHAADEENPFKKAKVGDYAEYKMTTGAMGANFESKMRTTVIAKDDKEAIIEVTGKIMNMGKEVDIPTQKQTIDLTKPYDPTTSANMPKSADVKIEKGNGTEKIMAGGKQYDCTWIKAISSFKIGDMSLESEMKIWSSKEVPLSGMVKMEMKSKFANVTMELTGSGSK
jgi:hypothetical protein